VRHRDNKSSYVSLFFYLTIGFEKREKYVIIEKETEVIPINKQLIKILANIIAIYLGTVLFSRITFSSISSILIAGIALWLVNLIIRPLLVLITIPVNILTLGLFSLVINTWMVMLVARLIDGFSIVGFWTAFGVALLVSLVNSVLGKTRKDK